MPTAVMMVLTDGGPNNARVTPACDAALSKMLRSAGRHGWWTEAQLPTAGAAVLAAAAPAKLAVAPAPFATWAVASASASEIRRMFHSAASRDRAPDCSRAAADCLSAAATSSPLLRSTLLSSPSASSSTGRRRFTGIPFQPSLGSDPWAALCGRSTANLTDSTPPSAALSACCQRCTVEPAAASAASTAAVSPPVAEGDDAFGAEDGSAARAGGAAGVAIRS